LILREEAELYGQLGFLRSEKPLEDTQLDSGLGGWKTSRQSIQEAGQFFIDIHLYQFPFDISKPL
jgi:hypothetical protein